jgi:hypothetical protein
MLCFLAGYFVDQITTEKILQPEKKVQTSGRRLKYTSDNQPSVLSKYKHQLQPEKITTGKKRYGRLAGYVFRRVPSSIKFQPEKITTGKKGKVIWPTIEINLRLPSVVSKSKHQLWLEKITIGKKGTVVWSLVGINLTL